MGLLDTILGKITNSGSSPDDTAHRSLLEHVIGMIGNNQTGGLGGLVDKLKAGGLGSAVSSWVGTGPNQSVTADQVGNALGSDQVSEIAQKTGLPTSEVTSHLSQILPQLISHLTPNGSVPDHGMVQSALNMLKGKLLGN